MIVVALSLIFSHKTFQILFSRYFGFSFFSAKLSSVAKLSPVNILSGVNIMMSSFPVIAGCLLEVYQDTDKS